MTELARADLRLGSCQPAAAVLELGDDGVLQLSETQQSVRVGLCRTKVGRDATRVVYRGSNVVEAYQAYCRMLADWQESYGRRGSVESSFGTKRELLTRFGALRLALR